MKIGGPLPVLKTGKFPIMINRPRIQVGKTSSSMAGRQRVARQEPRLSGDQRELCREPYLIGELLPVVVFSDTTVAVFVDTTAGVFSDTTAPVVGLRNAVGGRAGDPAEADVLVGVATVAGDVPVGMSAVVDIL